MIKNLIWNSHTPGDGHGYNTKAYVAKVIFGNYTILWQEKTKEWLWVDMDYGDVYTYDDLEEAMNVVQDNFNRKVRNLINLPDDTLEPALKAFLKWTHEHPADWHIGAIYANGKFARFANPDTDTAWLGFKAAYDYIIESLKGYPAW